MSVAAQEPDLRFFFEFEVFRTPILVDIATSYFAVSNGVGIMSVAAQEPNF